MKKYLVEFIGTFFLVLVIGLSVVGGAGSFAPIAIGGVLIGLIFAGGHISGAHYNPAVTFAIWLRGKCTTIDAIMYILVQIIAAYLAAVMVGYLNVGVVAGAARLNIVPSLLAEFFGTFVMMYVILNVATTKINAGNSFYGVAIGLTVVGCIYAFGGISGGVFNPAVAVGLVAMGIKSMGDIWIYFAAQLVAVTLAVLIFKYIYDGDE